ncbi:MAG: DUF1080 domain-containing protein [Bacteroidota bacterium]
MKKAVVVSVCTLIVMCTVQDKSFGQTCDPAIKLFNGTNLDGWYSFLQNRGRDNDPKNVFSVQDGMIRISGEEWGCITTNDEFENYRIVTEFKWGALTHAPRANKARDSGLLMHSQGEDGGSQGIWMHSIECQIIEGGTGDFIVVGDGSDQFQITCNVALEKQGGSYIFLPDGEAKTIQQGRINWLRRDPEWRDILGFRGRNDFESPTGEWNILVCEVLDGNMTIYLNGMLVNRATNVKPAKGRIQIQSEAAEIFFRRIDLIPL